MRLRGLLLGSSAHCCRWCTSHTNRSQLVLSRRSNHASKPFGCPHSMLTSGIAEEYNKGISILKPVKWKLSYFRSLYFITRWHCSKSFSTRLLSSLRYGYYLTAAETCRLHRGAASHAAGNTCNASVNLSAKRFYSDFDLNSFIYYRNKHRCSIIPTQNLSLFRSVYKMLSTPPDGVPLPWFTLPNLATEDSTSCFQPVFKCCTTVLKPVLFPNSLHCSIGSLAHGIWKK